MEISSGLQSASFVFCLRMIPISYPIRLIARQKNVESCNILLMFLILSF